MAGSQETSWFQFLACHTWCFQHRVVGGLCRLHHHRGWGGRWMPPSCQYMWYHFKTINSLHFLHVTHQLVLNIISHEHNLMHWLLHLWYPGPVYTVRQHFTKDILFVTHATSLNFCEVIYTIGNKFNITLPCFLPSWKMTEPRNTQMSKA